MGRGRTRRSRGRGARVENRQERIRKTHVCIEDITASQPWQAREHCEPPLADKDQPPTHPARRLLPHALHPGGHRESQHRDPGGPVLGLDDHAVLLPPSPASPPPPARPPLLLAPPQARRDRLRRPKLPAHHGRWGRGVEDVVLDAELVREEVENAKLRQGALGRFFAGEGHREEDAEVPEGQAEARAPFWVKAREGRGRSRARV